jgi:RNA polymerase sigma-70 factor, ECF subfamily
MTTNQGGGNTKPPPDPFGFEIIKYLPRLRKFCYSLTGKRDDDLVNDTIVTALAKQHLYVKDNNLCAWLCSILHRHFLTTLRKSKQRSKYDKDVILNYNTVNPISEQVIDLKQEIVKLPINLQELIIKLSIGESYEEIAEEYKCPIGTVRSRVHRGRHYLRELLN